jgi:hypothetical protein
MPAVGIVSSLAPQSTLSGGLQLPNDLSAWRCFLMRL